MGIISDSFTYFNILKHISQGVSRSSEIANCSCIKTTSIDYFLNVLMNDMDLLKKEIPVTAHKKSKITIYSIKDNFFRFWFRYIYPDLSEIEIGNTRYVIDKIKVELNRFIGLSFEEISKQYLIGLNKLNKLPFVFENIGRQWGKFKGKKGKNTYEIDLIAINNNTKEILFCECIWKNSETDINVIEELIKKSGFVEWNNNTRKDYFMVISKSGFTKRAQVFSKENKILLADLLSIDDWLND